MKLGYSKYILAFLVLIISLQVSSDHNLWASSANQDKFFAPAGQWHDQHRDDWRNDRNERAGVIIYRHAGFKGNNIFIPSGRDIWDLRSDGFNDEISSIEVVGGATVIVYEHKNYSGASARVSRSIADLARFDVGVRGGNWNDRISSLKVFGGHGYDDRDDITDENIICMFFESHRRNSPTLKGYIGKHHKIERNWNDRVSVVWVRKGYILTLFEHSDFRGEELVLRSTSGRRGGEFFTLEDYGFNNRMSSYILEKARRY